MYVCGRVAPPIYPPVLRRTRRESVKSDIPSSPSYGRDSTTETGRDSARNCDFIYEEKEIFPHITLRGAASLLVEKYYQYTRELIFLDTSD